jgi:O-antigen/teichoic acid export membrane protein
MVINNTTAELIGSNQRNKLQFLSQHLTKYLGIIIIPITILLIIYIHRIVLLLYGRDFLSVGIIFPFLIFSQMMPLIFNPISTIPSLSNDIRKIVYIGFGAAVLNVALDLWLIPSYSAFGAAIANSSAQLFTILLTFIVVRKYKLKFFTKYFFRVIGLNFFLLIALILIQFVFPYLVVQVIFSILIIFFYLKLIIKYAFNRNDYEIFVNLNQIAPKILQPVVQKLLKNMKS